ncbi:hypothetical protein QF022_002503 [Vogesella perlucida]|jgi:hypothetical protein|nr:hypothetical protein [Vogesella perlucida]
MESLVLLLMIAVSVALFSRKASVLKRARIHVRPQTPAYRRQRSDLY